MKNTTTTPQVKLTNDEATCLKHFQEGMDEPNAGWLHEIAPFEGKKLSGLISSMTKKGIISTNSEIINGDNSNVCVWVMVEEEWQNVFIETESDSAEKLGKELCSLRDHEMKNVKECQERMKENPLLGRTSLTTNLDFLKANPKSAIHSATYIAELAESLAQALRNVDAINEIGAELVVFNNSTEEEKTKGADLLLNTMIPSRFRTHKLNDSVRDNLQQIANRLVITHMAQNA